MPEYFKPSLDTKFHIDFDWWRQHNRKLGVHLASRLCPQCQPQHAADAVREIDWVDPFTGEVKPVDGLWEVVRGCCSQHPDYITPQTPLVFAVFLTFVANDNAPMTPVELQQALGGNRPASTILRTLSSREVFYGIRPVRAPVKRRRQSA